MTKVRISTVLKNIPNVYNMDSSRGNTVPNQFIITFEHGQLFKSYASIIAIKLHDGRVILDKHKWAYSVTTGKYRNDFLGETKAETEAKIASGRYKLANLN